MGGTGRGERELSRTSPLTYHYRGKTGAAALGPGCRVGLIKKATNVSQLGNFKFSITTFFKGKKTAEKHLIKYFMFFFLVSYLQSFVCNL